MKLVLENIAKVKKAEIEIKGITVIAGENNTGKSTVGKALYSIFNSFYHIDNQIRNEKMVTVSNLLRMLYIQKRNRSIQNYDCRKAADKILELQHEDKQSFIKDIILEFLFDYGVADAAFDDSEIDESVEKIEEILEISEEDILCRVITSKLNAEFNGQINNIYNDKVGKISLNIKDEQTKIMLSENSIKEISKPISLQTETVYLDDPFVLDEIGVVPIFTSKSMGSDHRRDVREKLLSIQRESTTIDKILINRKLDKIYEKIDSVCDGRVISLKRNGLGYQKKNSDKILDVKNISTGLKTFVILKTLLLNGALEENGTIILDEPEIHLHPQWQLLFAELIVLIQKEFNMHVLLNTHSPYFLQAIEVYAAKYGIADKCKYYLARLQGDMALIEDVSQSTEAIYKLLAMPFQDLENVRYGND